MTTKSRDAILEYLWRRFPHHCITMTDPGTRALIGLAERRAAAYGFQTPEHVCSWVNLMIFCGAGFDEDPLHEWAGRCLRETSSGVSRDDAMAELFRRLNENATAYLGEESSQHYRAALGRVARLQYETLPSDPNAPSMLHGPLRALYPERVDGLSGETLRTVAGQALEWVTYYELERGPGTLVCAVLILLFGSQVDRDPIRRWAGEALGAPAASAEKTRLVHEALVATLRRFANLDRFARLS